MNTFIYKINGFKNNIIEACVSYLTFLILEFSFKYQFKNLILKIHFVLKKCFGHLNFTQLAKLIAISFFFIIFWQF